MLWRTPNLLILHLMRFTGKQLSKINTNINYPIHDLNLDKYFSHHSPHKNNNLYSLHGINIHLGNSLNYGHYVSIVKNKINNNWYVYNDDCPLMKIEQEDQFTKL